MAFYLASAQQNCKHITVKEPILALERLIITNSWLFVMKKSVYTLANLKASLSGLVISKLLNRFLYLRYVRAR